MIELALLIWSVVTTVIANAIHIVALLLIKGKSVPDVTSTQTTFSHLPALTIIRPLKGLDSDAENCHRSLFEGRYQSAEVLFVVESKDDPAVKAVIPILEYYPDKARLLVSKPAPTIQSAKVRNMMTGWDAVQTPLVGFCDSDILLGEHHLETCMQAFADPLVSGVSVPIIYVADGLFGRLGMLVKTIDNSTFVRIASHMNFGIVTLGGLMIFRKDCIDAVGGPKVLGDALADDLRAGELLRRDGKKICLADAVLVHHTGLESTWSCLARHHRSLTSIRTELPTFFWLQFFLFNPVAVTLFTGVSLSVSGSVWAPVAWGIFGFNMVLRTLLTFAIDRTFLHPHGVRLGAWCLARVPADLVFFIELIATLVFPFVYWRGRWFRVKWGSGRILREVGKFNKTP